MYVLSKVYKTGLNTFLKKLKARAGNQSTSLTGNIKSTGIMGSPQIRLVFQWEYVRRESWVPVSSKKHNGHKLLLPCSHWSRVLSIEHFTTGRNSEFMKSPRFGWVCSRSWWLLELKNSNTNFICQSSDVSDISLLPSLLTALREKEKLLGKMRSLLA